MAALSPAHDKMLGGGSPGDASAWLATSIELWSRRPRSGCVSGQVEGGVGARTEFVACCATPSAAAIRLLRDSEALFDSRLGDD
jgi:hypothetical protein